MDLDTPPFVERGLLTLPDAAWELANRRAHFIAPLLRIQRVDEPYSHLFHSALCAVHAG